MIHNSSISSSSSSTTNNDNDDNNNDRHLLSASAHAFWMAYVAELHADAGPSKAD